MASSAHEHILKFKEAECVIPSMSYYDNRQSSFNWYNDN